MMVQGILLCSLLGALACDNDPDSTGPGSTLQSLDKSKTVSDLSPAELTIFCQWLAAAQDVSVLGNSVPALVEADACQTMNLPACAVTRYEGCVNSKNADGAECRAFQDCAAASAVTFNAAPKSPYVLALYYTDWDAFSRQFLPTWADVKTAIGASPLSGKVECKEYNCDTNKARCTQYQIRGFPTVLLHAPNGTYKEYDGVRTTAGVTAFVAANVN